MPLNLQKNLPAVELLKKEHIFVMDSLRASEQDIRPLRVVVLNLMPLKITTETDLVRLLSNTPLQVELDFMKIKGHTPKNTPIEHMKEFYKDFDEMQDDFYDGMYNPQNEMFRLLGTKRSFSQNETFFFSHPYPPTLPFSA